MPRTHILGVDLFENGFLGHEEAAAVITLLKR